VVEETDRACKDEQAAENDNWPRAFHEMKAKILCACGAAFNVLRIE
jgi:hypothetical protein